MCFIFIYLCPGRWSNLNCTYFSDGCENHHQLYSVILRVFLEMDQPHPHIHMCAGGSINSHCFPMVRMVINLTVGVYIPNYDHPQYKESDWPCKSHGANQIAEAKNRAGTVTIPLPPFPLPPPSAAYRRKFVPCHEEGVRCVWYGCFGDDVEGKNMETSYSNWRCVDDCIVFYDDLLHIFLNVHFLWSNARIRLHHTKWIAQNQQDYTRWFKVTFSSPSWRSQKTLQRVTFSPSQKGHELNHQAYKF